MNRTITLIFFLLTSSIIAQVKGKVTDTKNTELPFVSVYIENSGLGTTTNNNGEYRLNLAKPGTYEITFQFLGYKTVKKKVTVGTAPTTLNVQLQEEQVSLEEVQIDANENPADNIIRQAIANKKKNRAKTGSFTADFYSRGLFKIKNAPKRFLGQEIGDFGGGLDSTRSGIVYLSETISKIKSQDNPKKFNEYIVASKVSGQDNGISFNQAEDVNFDFYNNTFDLGQSQMISPIANSAFGYYNYKLAGTFYDKNGQLINKIKLLPKRQNDPVFNGHLYIVEDDWSIYGADVNLTGAQAGIPMIKNLFIKQNYRFNKQNNTWAIATQTIDFKAGMLGINFDGRFSAAYSNYNFEPDFTKKSFSNEVLAFSKNATEKDTSYWNQIRTVPLTKEEVADYQLKDSIKVVRKSKKYLDSIDAKSNKFNLMNLAMGYTYDNSYKKWSVNVSSPVFGINFNTVQGWNTGINIDFTKELKDKKSYGFGIAGNYGFSDKKFRPVGYFSYSGNRITRPFYYVSGGITTRQFNSNAPISKFWNTVSSVLFERNYLKIYEKRFAKIGYSEELFNGFKLSSSLEYAKRNPLFNTTNYVMFPQKDVDYTSNNPQQPNNFSSSFEAHSIWSLRLGLTIRFDQKYMSYPKSKVNLNSNKYPRLYLGYRKNFGASNDEWNSDYFETRLDQRFNLGTWGQFKYKLRGGIFLEQKDLPFMDYAHFNGNRLLIAPNDNYLNGFLALPYYQLSTNDKFGEVHVEQNFKGAILSKIPLINQLNFHLVGGFKGLYTAGNKPYTEFNVGLDNIGFGKWRLLRFDYVRSNFNGQAENRFLIGIKF